MKKIKNTKRKTAVKASPPLKKPASPQAKKTGLIQPGDPPKLKAVLRRAEKQLAEYRKTHPPWTQEEKAQHFLSWAPGYLSVCRNIAESWSIRKDAAVIREVAKARGLKNLYRQAAEVISRAEMTTVDLLPPTPPKARGAGKKIVMPDNDLSQASLRQMRHAYPEDQADREAGFAEAGRLQVSANREFFKKRRVKRRIEAARAERIEAVKRRPKLKEASVYNLPIADLEKKLAPESVDIVFTDPLYNESGIPTYSELSRFAGKVLKPGGSLLALSGGEFLPKIISRICEDKRLKWNFLLTLYMPGGQTAWRPPPRVNVSSKPILWLVKGKYAGPTVNNTIDNTTDNPIDNTIKAPSRKKAPSKERHPFAQSPKAMYEIIRRFYPKGKIVCDPFCGLGSLPLAAKALGAGVIASDIKKEHADEARRWLKRAEDKGGDLAIEEMEIELSK